MKRKDGPGPLVAVVIEEADLEREPWTVLAKEVLAAAKARNYFTSAPGAVDPSLSPALVLLVGEGPTAAWKASPCFDGATPSASILSPSELLRVGHPTPTSKLRVKRAASAVRRLLKKATGPAVATCAHPETIEVGRWEGGRKPGPVQVCGSCWSRL